MRALVLLTSTAAPSTPAAPTVALELDPPLVIAAAPAAAYILVWLSAFTDTSTPWLLRADTFAPSR